MSEKTSEDLVFEKLKYPDLREIFAEQLRDPGIDKTREFSVWYMERYSNGDMRVLTTPYSKLNEALKDFEYVKTPGRLPTFTRKKD